MFHNQEQEIIDNVDDDEYFNCLPRGYRFDPTDEELIVHYLKTKLQNLPLPRNKITEVNIYDHHPQTLAEQYKSKMQGNYLYFFTPSSNRAAAGNGYWKVIRGHDRAVKHNGGLVGLRKSLVYYVGKPQKGRKTKWHMHEYRMNPPSNDIKLDDWVLCRIREKNNRQTAGQ